MRERAPRAGEVGGPPLFVRKTADESVTSSTTLQDDDHLSTPLAANGVYLYQLRLIYDGATAGDLKYTWILPTGATWSASVVRLTDAATGLNNVQFDANPAIASGVAPTAGALGSGSSTTLFLDGLFVVSATAGTAQFQWAQNASSATATRLFTNSYLLTHRVA